MSEKHPDYSGAAKVRRRGTTRTRGELGASRWMIRALRSVITFRLSRQRKRNKKQREAMKYFGIDKTPIVGKEARVPVVPEIGMLSG